MIANKLGEGATTPFGAQETDQAFGVFLRSCSAVSGALDGLKNSEVKQDGTNATIIFKSDGKNPTPNPLRLQQTGGQWKIVLGDEINAADFDQNAMEECLRAWTNSLQTS